MAPNLVIANRKALLDFGGRNSMWSNRPLGLGLESGGLCLVGCQQGCWKAGAFSGWVCEGVMQWPGRIPPSHKLCGLALITEYFLLIIWSNLALFVFSLKPESPLLFPYYPRKSLHFVKRRMENIIDQCLQKPAVSSKRRPLCRHENIYSVWLIYVNDHSYYGEP